MQRPAVLEMSTHTHTHCLKSEIPVIPVYQFRWCLSLKHGEQKRWRGQNWHLSWGKSKKKEKTIL